MAYFLGLDSSTQSLSAIVIDTSEGRVVVDESVNFGSELPAYESPQGVLPSQDPRVRHSDPLMWVEALELLLTRVRERGFNWSKIAGISGAGQQHGSVYLKEPLRDAGRFKSSQSLVDQVRPLLSYPTSPMWMDSSTGEECKEIAAAAGGRERVLVIHARVRRADHDFARRQIVERQLDHACSRLAGFFEQPQCLKLLAHRCLLDRRVACSVSRRDALLQGRCGRAR